MRRNHQELIEWLQKWYYQHCDGDWEHNENINIHTIDNPGWHITIDLEGTHCEHKPFKNIDQEISDDNWYHCFLRDDKFEGVGGPCNLFDVLNTFKEWVESIEGEKK